MPDQFECGERVAVRLRPGTDHLSIDGMELVNGVMGMVVGHVGISGTIVSFDESTPGKCVTIEAMQLRRVYGNR